jgi:hypothetical protein
MPVNVCEASMNREKRSQPSNTVAVGVNGGVADTVVVDVNVGVDRGGSLVVACGAQAVIASNATIINRWSKR